ncbi:hypothetical protein F7725_022078 [Dissostichus mawsoni]|uniref:Uncharacterized protein n=1 Tax=Dissostichus mawsoni TaxID=36200 RepID=A0A7J5ZF91_DISMA|nr:hypothetical protein F7725_022078 [Dissostichus mawsoni]
MTPEPKIKHAAGSFALVEALQRLPVFLHLLHHLRAQLHHRLVMSDGEDQHVERGQAAFSQRHVFLHLRAGQAEPAGPVSSSVSLSLPPAAPEAPALLLTQHVYLFFCGVEARPLFARLVFTAEPVRVLRHVLRLLHQLRGLQSLHGDDVEGVFPPGEQLPVGQPLVVSPLQSSEVVSGLQVIRQVSTEPLPQNLVFTS